MGSVRTNQARRFSLVVANIFEAAGRLRRSGEAIARRHGQSQARWQVLSVVSEGRWTVPRIAERLGVTRQGVQRIADELVEHRLAGYEDNAKHQRSPFLVPTASGLKKLALITESAREFDAKLSRAVGERDLELLAAALERILVELRGEGS